MSQLSEWADALKKMGEKREREREEKLNKMREELPTAIKELSIKTNKALIELLQQFALILYDEEEEEIRAKFRGAIENEILRRMGD